MPPDDPFPYEAICPWCDEGKLMIEKPADTKVSCRCPRCRKHYEVDFKTMTVKKSEPVPYRGNKNRKQATTA